MYPSLLDRKLRAEIFHFLSKRALVGDYELRAKPQRPHQLRAQLCARPFPLSPFVHERNSGYMSASCSCYEVSSLSDQAAHVSRAHRPRDTTPRVPFLTACYRHAFTEQIRMYARFIAANNKLQNFHCCDGTARRPGHDGPRESEISCCRV